MTVLRLIALATLSAMWTISPAAGPPVDYAFFKERVQPIFLKKRPVMRAV